MKSELMRWGPSMALDDLLDRLEQHPALHEFGVARVTGVTPGNGAGSSVTPDLARGVTRVTPRAADDEPVTPVTLPECVGLHLKAAPVQGCTLVTPATPQIDEGQGVTARAWLLHFSDREPLEVWFAPAADQAEALAVHLDALAAEPLGKTSVRTATADEAEELRALLAAIYGADTEADTEADRRDAMHAALTVPEGALACYRAIAEERGLAIEDDTRAEVRNAVRAESACCRICRHRTRPGHAEPGYCALRTDTPHAYGPGHPLHRLPDDGDADCEQFEDWT
jgi:hypothetical protein